MGNRKQPFGYKITLGEVVIHTEEARVVQQIFKQYLAGESLQKLADTLRVYLNMEEIYGMLKEACLE